jgi:hypothetical protein
MTFKQVAGKLGLAAAMAAASTIGTHYTKKGLAKLDEMMKEIKKEESKI